MKKWWLWVLLATGVLLMAVGITFIVSPTLIELVSKDKPQFSQDEVIALVKRDLTQLGIEGHKIESVGVVSDVRYSGDGIWQGLAEVSYSYQDSWNDLRSFYPRRTIPGQPPEPPQPPTYYIATATHTVSWNFYEKLRVTEITNW